MKALYVMDKDVFGWAFDDETKKEIARLLGEESAFVTGDYLKANPEMIKGIEVLFTSYGAGALDYLWPIADCLKIVFFAGGSVKILIGNNFWNKGIIIANAGIANDPPVAEFAFAQILLALKRFFFHSQNYKENKEFKAYESFGAYKSNVGIISYGAIAKHLCRLLKNTDINIHVYSPSLDEKTAALEGMIYSPLDKVFEVCDVVSLHTPILTATQKMIKESHFLSMKQNAAFINTARGGVVDEEGMIAALRKRPDITALLDVTTEEPLPSDSALFTLQNVILTPHIAGAQYKERNRLGRVVLEDLTRYLDGEPLRNRVREQDLTNKA